MYYCDFSITLDIGTLIIAVPSVIAIIVYFFSKKRLKKLNFDIDECELGLTGGTIRLRCNKIHQQIAYRIWVDINTRVIATKIDLDVDNIRVVNDSYYKCFTDTRELLKEIPVNKINNDGELVNLIVRFLNEVMRPYLTKWGVTYNNWYDNKIKTDEMKGKNPVEIQKSYPYYEELSNDLLSINEKVMKYSDKLHEIAFSDVKKKRIKEVKKHDK